MIGNNFLTKQVRKFPLACVFRLTGCPRLLKSFVGVCIEGQNLLVRNLAALVFNLSILFVLKLNFLGGTNTDWKAFRSCLQTLISLALSAM